MEILNMLIEQLGVTEDQAKGGAGSILSLAKEKLGDADFSKVAQAIPGMEDLLEAAPESVGLAGMVGGLASKIGGGAEKLGSLAGLANGFKGLGLDFGMVGKFIPIVLSFVQSKGGDSIKNLLAGALK